LAKKYNSGNCKVIIHRTGRKLTLIQISVQQKKLKIKRETNLSIVKEKLKVVEDNLIALFNFLITFKIEFVSILSNIEISKTVTLTNFNEICKEDVKVS